MFVYEETQAWENADAAVCNTFYYTHTHTHTHTHRLQELEKLPFTLSSMSVSRPDLLNLLIDLLYPLVLVRECVCVCVFLLRKTGGRELKNEKTNRKYKKKKRKTRKICVCVCLCVY